VKQKLQTGESLEIADLLADSFNKKIESVWIMTKNKNISVPLIQESMNRDQCLVYKKDGKVAGICGLEMSEAPIFIDISFSSFNKYFSFLPALFRFFAYKIYKKSQGQIADHSIFIDLLAVDAEFRGQNIGTTLLKQAEDLASHLNKKYLVLEVVNTNDRAKKLYETFGFKEKSYEEINVLFKPFTKAANFTGFTTMVKEIE